jgi:hypothetical protein
MSLERIFGAIVRQGTLEEAAEEMASLAASYSEMKAEFTGLLAAAINAAALGDSSVVKAVNRSGYQVASPEEAGQYCSELLALFSAATLRHS